MILIKAAVVALLISIWGKGLPQKREATAYASGTDLITQKVSEILEKLKGEMKEGLPEHNIPPLDPLKIDSVSLGPIKLGAVGKLNVAKFDNVQVIGLPNFTLENIKTSVSALQLNLTLYFPLLAADGNYEVDGILASIFPIFGKGKFQLYARDIRAGGKAKLSIKDKRVSLKNLQLHSTIGRLDNDVTGLLGGGDLGEQMNRLVQKSSLQLIEQLKPKMTSVVSEFVRLRINDKLKNVDIGDVIG